MLIDWFTVGAQLLNFVILLVALKLLLFDRIVEAMEERRARIDGERRAAAEAREEAEQEAEHLREERAALEDARDRFLQDARDDAERRRHELLQEARDEVDDEEHRWRQALYRRQDHLARHLQQQAGERVVRATRKALADLADTDLEDAVARGFVRTLAALDEEERDGVADALRPDDAPILVRTGFELSEATRDTVRGAVRDLVSDSDATVEWEHDSDILAGIQVETEVARLGWTIDGYLDDLLEGFTRSIRSATETRSSEDRDAATTGSTR